MILKLTRAKTNAPVEIDTEKVLLITPMKESVRIVTDTDVFYVKESLGDIAAIRSGIKNPDHLVELKNKIETLRQEMKDLSDKIEAKRGEILKTKQEYNELAGKLREALDIFSKPDHDFREIPVIRPEITGPSLFTLLFEDPFN